MPRNYEPLGYAVRAGEGDPARFEFTLSFSGESPVEYESRAQPTYLALILIGCRTADQARKLARKLGVRNTTLVPMIDTPSELKSFLNRGDARTRVVVCHDDGTLEELTRGEDSPDDHRRTGEGRPV